MIGHSSPNFGLELPAFLLSFQTWNCGDVPFLEVPKTSRWWNLWEILSSPSKLRSHDLTRPHPKWWFSKGNPLISGKSRLVKYYILTSSIRPETNSDHLKRSWLSDGFFLSGKLNLADDSVSDMFNHQK